MNISMRICASVIILFTALTGCSKKAELSDSAIKPADSAVTTRNQPLTEYLSTLNKVELPVTIRGCNGVYDAGNKILEKGKDTEPSDSSPYFKNYHHPFGQLAVPGSFTAIITLGVADCMIPELVTLDMEGAEIDRKTIAIGYCGSDCGYSCREFMSIGKDFTLYTSDTIKSYECDSLGYAIPETEEHYVIYKQGKLLPSGKIELSEELKKELK